MFRLPVTPGSGSYVAAAVIVSCAAILADASDCRSSPREICLPLRPAHGLYPFERLEPVRPRLTIALSGGGARCLAHIGILEALEEADVHPDGLVGSSTGALVGGLYAAGFTPAEIKDRLLKFDWGSVLLDEPERKTLPLARKEEHSRHLLTLRLDRHMAPVVPGAISPGQRLYQTLLELTLDAPFRPVGPWTGLRVPLIIPATDLPTGQSVIIDRGDLTPALRGSLSIPLLFDPLILGTLQLIDGGITANIPVEIAREMGGDVVLAVNATSPLRRTEPPYHPWQIVDQVTTILEREADDHSLSLADIVVTPDLGDVQSTSTIDSERLINTGREAMREAMPELLELLRPSPEDDDNMFLTFIAVTLKCDGNKGDPQTEGLPIPPPEWSRAGGATVGQVRELLRRIYTSGTVCEARAFYDSESETLRFHIRRNPTLQRVIFNGDRLLPDSLLAAPFEPLYGRPMDYDSTRSALEQLLRIYRSAGFPAATITDLSFDASSGAMSIGLKVGRLGGIRFIGIERVPESWLKREIPLHPGRPITRAGILDGTANLYATGLFRSVYPVLHLGQEPGETWTLELYVSEHPAPPVRLGLAYQGERKTRGFIELIHPSPFNYAARLVLFASPGQRDAEYRIEGLDDKAFGLPLIYKLSFGYCRRERALYNSHHDRSGDYTEARWGGNLEVGGPSLRWGLLSLTSRWEQHENRYPDRKKDYLLAAVGARLAVDTEDRTPFPNRGIRAQAGFETSGSYLGSGRDFTRLWGRWEGFETPLHRHTFGLRVGAGIADLTTPGDERFRLGGMHSFPGLHLDEAIGALQMAAGCEYRFDLISRVLADSYLGLRFDVAGSWPDPDAQILDRDWMQSFALYFAFDTLLGPLMIQWGHLMGIGAPTAQDILFVQCGNLF